MYGSILKQHTLPLWFQPTLYFHTYRLFDVHTGYSDASVELNGRSKIAQRPRLKSLRGLQRIEKKKSETELELTASVLEKDRKHTRG